MITCYFVDDLSRGQALARCIASTSRPELPQWEPMPRQLRAQYPGAMCRVTKVPRAYFWPGAILAQAAAMRFFNSSAGTSSLCVESVHWYPKGSPTVPLRSP